MQVYIEYVIIDNFIIDYLILKVSLVLSREPTSVFRLLLASAVGTAVAVIIPLFTISSVLAFFIKILLGLLISVIAVSDFTLSKVIKVYGFFMLFTALLGGAVIGVFYLAGVEYTAYFSLNYNSFMPIGITIFIVFIISKLVIKWVGNLLRYKDIRPFLRKCVIVTGGEKIKINGFIDSGNSLIDADSGLPIMVASVNLISKLEKVKNAIIPLKSISYETVSGSSEMKIYLIDKLIVYDGIKANIYKRVLIGNGKVNFNLSGDYDILLSPSMF